LGVSVRPWGPGVRVLSPPRQGLCRWLGRGRRVRGRGVLTRSRTVLPETTTKNTEEDLTPTEITA